MNKAYEIFRREYVERVRKKSFLILTLVGPLLLSVMVALPQLLIGSSPDRVQQLASKIRDGLRALNTAAADKPEMQPETQKMLHDYYAEEIDSLEKLTGLSLENWRR